MTGPWDDYGIQAAQGPWTDYAKAKPETAGSYYEGLAEKGAQGATFGLADELAAGLGAGSNWLARKAGLNIPERSYEQILNEVRGREHEFEERHPYASIGAEVAGGASTLAAAPAKILQAPTWGARALRSAGIGAGYGAATGFGTSEGGVGNRIGGTARGAAIGSVLTPAIADVALPAIMQMAKAVPAGVRYANRAALAAKDPEAAAFKNIADKGVQSGIDWDKLLTEISPQPSPALAGRNFTTEDLADIISRQLGNEDAATIASEYTAAGKPVAASTVKDYLKRYLEMNPTPRNVVDVANEVSGAGTAGPLTRYARAVHGIAGGEDPTLANALINRQLEQPGRVSAIIERYMGGKDMAARREAHLDALRQESDKAYKDFYAQPELATDQLGDLMQEPLFQSAVKNAQRQERLDIIKDNQALAKQNAANQQLGKSGQVVPLNPVPDLNQETQIFSPQLLDYIQRDLRLTAEGRSNPNEARYAQNLRNVFLDRIEQHYPDFAKIRETYAGGKMEQDAFDAGVKLTTRLGAPAREALSDYNKMTPAQKAIFRDSFGAALQDQAANTPAGAQAANKFTTPAFRQIIDTLYPKSDKSAYKDGQALLKQLRTEATTTATKNAVLSGSRTAEYASDMDRMTTGAEAAAHLATGNWVGIMRTLGKRLAQQIGTDGAKASMKILSETDPAKLLPTLQRLAREAKSYQERQAYVATIRELHAGAISRTTPAIGYEAGKQSAFGQP